MDVTDLGEMMVVAVSAKEAGFPRVEIDPDHLIEILDLAIGAKREEEDRESLAR